jgi:hypothetical protein
MAKQLVKTMSQLVKNAPVNPIINNNTTNNTTNNNTTNNITNNITNTNNIIMIQHINPFGLENTDFLTFNEKLEILRSGYTSCIKILKIVYSRSENKNFYKVNKKSSSISYLNENLNMDVFQQREFRIELFKNSTTLLYGIMLDCKNKLCFEEQLELMDNITSIKNDVYSEIFNNGLSNLKREIGETILDNETKHEIDWGINNIIGQEIENNNDNNRKLLVEYIKKVKTEPDAKVLFNKNILCSKKQKEIINNQLNDTSLGMEEVDEKYGQIKYGQLANQLQLSHYSETLFAKTLNAREKMEINIVKANNTLGKLKEYSTLHRNRKKNIENILIFEKDINKLRELSDDN